MTMTDLRAAILARCDELERIAKLACDAADPEDDGKWDPLGSGIVHDNQMRRVTSPSPGLISTVRADAIGSHVATWDPAAVLALAAGAREMCEIHRPESGHLDCTACAGPTAAEERRARGARLVLWPCPTLAALARMIGVNDA